MLKTQPSGGLRLATPWVPRGLSRISIGAAAAVHMVLGWVLLEEPLFQKYPDLARLMGEGRLTGDLLTDASPAYLLLTVLLGPSGLLIVQRLAGAGLVILVAAATRRLTEVSWAPAAAAWATALAAPLVLYEAVMEPDALIAVASFAAMVAIPWEVKRLTWSRALAAGALLGLAVSLRPSVLLLLVGAVGLLWWRDRDRSRCARLVRPAVALAVGLIIGLAPGAALSARLDGDARAVMSVGQVVNMGNRPEATGIGASMVFLAKSIERQHAHPDRPDYSHEVYRQLARAGSDEPLGPFEAELYWVGRSLSWARHDPGRYLLLGARKVLFLLGPTPAHDITVVRAHANSVPGVPAWLLWPVGLSGLLFLALRGRLPAELLVLLAASLVHVLAFYVSSRYRLPLVPLLATTGAAGVAQALALLGRPADRPRSAILGLAAVALAVVPGLAPGTEWAASVQARSLAATVLVRQFEYAATGGDLALAADRAAAAVAAHPGVLWTRHFRGVDVDDPRFREAVLGRAAEVAHDDVGRYLHGWALRRAGRYEEAARLQESLAESSSFAFAIFDRVWDPHLEAARSRARLGQDDRARAALAGAARPASLEVLALASLVGTPEQAQRARTRLFAIHDRCSALLALGQAAITIGRPSEGLDPLEELRGRLPGAALGLWYLGVARVDAGDPSGHSDLAEAHRLFPRYAFSRIP